MLPSRTDTLLGSDVKERYADLKKASADRCPRLLGTFVKAPEVQYHHDVYNQLLLEYVLGVGAAGPSTPLRSGRDDTSVWER